METGLTYNQIYKALFSKGIEKYVPDGASISHPVVDMRYGKIVDCFLIYTISRDNNQYTAPIARIVIDSENKSLIDYNSTQEQPFSVYTGIDYFTDNTDINIIKEIQDAEREYQISYMKIRTIAFKSAITPEERDEVVRYIKLLKSVERVRLQPFLFELATSFFSWVKCALKSP